jgi:hypothetical protein
VRIPVIAVANIYEPEVAEVILAEGCCDLVGVACGHLADPEWCNKAKADNGFAREKITRFVDSMIAQVEESGVELCLGEEATVEKVGALSPCGVFIACSAWRADSGCDPGRLRAGVRVRAVGHTRNRR